MVESNSSESVSAAPTSAEAAPPPPAIDAAADQPKTEPVIAAPPVEPAAIEAPTAAATALDAPGTGEPQAANIDEPGFDAADFDAAAGASPPRQMKLLQAPKARPAKTLTMFIRAPAAADVAAPARSKPWLLAATFALAASFGAVAGALGVYGLTAAEPAPADAALSVMAGPAAADNNTEIQSAVTELRTELAALKTSMTTATRAAAGQFTKITERFDRIDRAQAEPAAKLAKALETLDRLDRRADRIPVRETTGSIVLPPAAREAARPVVIGPPAPAVPALAAVAPAAVAPVAVAAAPALPAASAATSVDPSAPQIVPGWAVREVYRGIATLYGSRLGLIEVELGDVVPGLGRVETFRRQEGRWVVVTSRGLVMSR
jgi:hypothetical protein